MSHQCVACYMQTDRAVSVAGSMDWMIAAMMAMEIPEYDARLTVKHAFKEWKAKPPCVLRLQVCRKCAAKGGFETASDGVSVGSFACYVEPGMTLSSTMTVNSIPTAVVSVPWSPPGEGKHDPLQ